MPYWNATRGAIAKIEFESGGAFGNTIDTYFVIYKKVKALFDVLNTYSADEHNIIIKERGSIKTNFNFDDLLLVPTQMNFTVYDGDGFLKAYIFDSTVYEKDFYVYQLLNNNIIFAGKVIVNTLEYDEGTKEIKFNSISPTDRLNNTSLFYDSEFLGEMYTSPSNPLLNINATRYEMNVDKTAFTNDYVLLNDLIKDIYKYAGIEDVAISSNWLFRSAYTVNDNYTLDMLYIKLSYFFIEDNFQTLGDILKYLSQCLACYTGTTDFSSAFFKKLMYGTAYPIIDDDPTYSYKESYELGKLDYVEIGTTGAISKYQSPNSESYNNSMYSSFKLELPRFYYNTDVGFVEVTTAKDPLISDSYLSMREIVSKYWYMIRGDYDKSKVIHFRFPNLNRKFTDLIYYNNNSYQIIDFEMSLSNNETIIKAVKTL